MNKLKLHTPDLTAANIEKIAALFPNCVTEATDESGKLKRAIDFDLLKQELSADLVEGPQERYRLDWPGKREALALANQPITKTLRPCREESVDFENTQNLYIEGDNLDALRLLQETYLGKVKMIYIDPPYNTGNDFIYDDNFSMKRGEYDELSGDRDEEGNAMFDAEKWKQNSSANGRYHSEWLSMIYPRLKLARNLLQEDGAIFISVDDGEIANLRRMCDEVFGADNFIATFCWKRKKEISSDSKNVAVQGEYLLLFARSPALELKLEPLSENYIDSSYNDPTDEFPEGRWRPVPITVSKGLSGGGYNYKIISPSGNVHNRIWAYPEHSFKRLVDDKRIYWGKSRSGVPQRVIYAHESKGQPTTNYWDSVATNKEGKKAILDLFDEAVFDTAKPPGLIIRAANLVIGNEDLVLDFFSGSATTAHAVMQLNAEDGGKRRHIMVQLPEPCDEKSEAFKAGYQTIAEIGKERIRRAGQKILQEWQAKQAKEQSAERDLLHPRSTIHDLPSPPDIGFRVLKISDSNFREIERTPEELDQKELALHTEHIKPDRTSEDLLFQVLVDWGVDLALSIVSETLHGKRVFFVDENALAACFDTGLSDELVHAIAARKPLRAVFRDDGFGDDSTRINVEQIFKLLSPGTEVKAL
jgi:adenine-specific DNA-methyltransferase